MMRVRYNIERGYGLLSLQERRGIMKVIYLTHNIEKDFVGETIAEKLDVELIKLPIILWEQQKELLCEAALILIEHSHITTVSEKIVWEVSSQLTDLTSCIILTKDMDFKVKINYYNLGVSAIIETTDNVEEELYQYFLFSLNEYEIIKYLQSMKIAVIDDSRFSLEVIRSYFERCQVNNADYYQEANDLLKQISDYDLFLLDLVMPKFTGQELIRHIRRQNKNAIIIIITTYGEGISIPYGMNIGADDFLIKPFNFKLFLLRLTACVRNRMLSIEKRESTKKLYELATRDSLTNLYNRRFFVEFLEERIREGRRDNKTFSMILLDLDHFKEINDEFGHLEGDKVLCQVATTLQGQLRDTDIICRWGGEEFAVFLPGAELYEAGIVAEKLRSSIAAIQVNAFKQITASFGATQWLADDDAESIFKRVDNSLYLAKLTGRNKVISNENVFMYKGGLPISIEWGPFFRSGHQEVDYEHNSLIALSNELIVNCFMEDNFEKTSQLLERICVHMVEHFSNEEKVLYEYRYIELEEHKEIHKELLKSMQYLMEAMYKGELEQIDLAKYIIQEIIIGHIIKHDFRFFELFSK